MSALSLDNLIGVRLRPQQQVGPNFFYCACIFFLC
ncbi:hypothetical protein ACJIZ3_009728 [Penstemon smallii]|uniref:Uncharacterized protein n=1 Tax=Penstemon smallii TaxID=265156 RepID=A0ABD3TDB9_9LAMI